MKTRLIIVGIIVIAFIIWRVSVRHHENIPADTNQIQTQNEPAPAPANIQSPDNNQGNTQLHGVLKKSSDETRGNLMLELDDSDRIIYFSSTNGYPDLIGKEVIVTYSGDIASPVIIDIKAQ